MRHGKWRTLVEEQVPEGSDADAREGVLRNGGEGDIGAACGRGAVNELKPRERVGKGVDGHRACERVHYRRSRSG